MIATVATDVEGGGGRMGVFKPIVQYGFAGFCAVLLAVTCWRMHCGDSQFSALIACTVAIASSPP
jgi:hypothetical protein